MEVEELNDERKRQKLSVVELAERANLPKATVEKILFGIVKHPRIDTMRAIESALGLDKTSVELSDEDKALGAQEVPLFPLSEEEQDLLELRSEIIRLKGEDFWKSLEVMLQAIAKEKNNTAGAVLRKE